MATLYVLCGLPFSGKSTWATQHSQKSGSLVISLDKINEQRGLGFGGDGHISAEQWEETHQIALQQVAELLENGESVIVDDTGCYAWLRKRYIDLAKQSGNRAVIVWFDVDSNLIERRMRETAFSQDRPTIAPDVMDQLIKTFENPTDDEAPIIQVSSM